MDERLKKAWTDVIQAEDYEAHMAAVGQAQSNAQLVANYLRTRGPEPGASLLFLGAGTGQMFDFVSPSILLPYRTTFADINESYLQRLAERLRQKEDELRYATVIDDVENSRLPEGREPGFHTVIVVLLLEHVDWRKGVATIARLTGTEALVIIQENPATLTAAMTPTREVTGTMKIFKDVHPTLIPRKELEAEFAGHGFAANYSAEETVADNKKMVAIGFRRNS